MVARRKERNFVAEKKGFNKNTTKNIMTYINGIDSRRFTWYWQWKIMNKNFE